MQRKSIRFEIKNGVALTPYGTCRVTNLSKGGLALRCFEELLFPPEGTMDLYDETGLNFQDLRVRKVWTKRLNRPGVFSHSQVEAGWAFENLSSDQESKLSSYLMQLGEAEISN